ncbi:serine/threonine-protein kinase [Oxalobacteraceae bacterium]|nr:serine/threonine-protein kinase [Oxalobacteraceae bacterium]
MHTIEQLRSGELQGLQRVKLACGLTEFPRELFNLADTLEILDLSGNALSALPDDLPRLSKLRIIFCSDNLFTTLPAVLGRCEQLSMIGFKANRIHAVEPGALPPTLRWLVLTDNELTELPAAIGDCQPLEKLMLAGNRLRVLPEELANCSKLALLRIAANQLSALPDWLLNLPRLSWLACAGNPFSDAAEQAIRSGAQLDSIAWNRLQLHEQLGEGASGVIYRAALDDGAPGIDAAAQAVAVKLFKGTLTSDGLPRCEMAASIGAGRHANLIPVKGDIARHPDGVSGLVMDLIDPDFGNLAGPPSLDSCSRDVYPADKRFDFDTLLEIAHGIASASAHLHSRGIMHGDLYGHNVLHCERGRTLLGDFGAASFFAPASGQAAALQQLEVRAFGYLLEELLDRCSAPSTPEILSQLKSACLSDDRLARPLFSEIERQLGKLKVSP